MWCRQGVYKAPTSALQPPEVLASPCLIIRGYEAPTRALQPPDVLASPCLIIRGVQGTPLSQLPSFKHWGALYPPDDQTGGCKNFRGLQSSGGCLVPLCLHHILTLLLTTNRKLFYIAPLCDW